MQRAKMKKQIIKTENAPSAIGPYNQAVKAGITVYISGQIPLDHASGTVSYTHLTLPTICSV